MKLEDARNQFIASWGAFGSQWGINRTMAQIHALLLVSHDALSAEDIMEKLNISRGNANMNIRELINWGLVERILQPGERKEFFVADKDIWRVAKQIMKERKKRELEPMLKALDQFSKVDDDPNDKEVKAFTDTMGNIRKFGQQADKTLDLVIRSDENWFLNTLVRLFK